MTGQVRLIVEACLGRRQAGWHPVEQQPPRELYPPARHVLMRADPEFPAEHPDQVGGVGVESVRRFPEGHLLVEPDVDQVPKVSRQADVGLRRPGRGTTLGQVAAESFGDECQPVLRLEFVARLTEYLMQLVNPLPEERVRQHGLVDGPAG